MHTPTKRSLLLAALIYILALVGLISLNGAVLALALPLVVYISAALLFQPPPLQLQLQRTLSDNYIGAGDTVTVTLTVTNQGRQLEELYLQDVVPWGLEVKEGHADRYLSLPAGDSHTYSYTVTGQRGTYRFREFRAIASESTGLFRRRDRYPLVSNLYVLPEVQQLRNVTIRPLRTRGFAGPIPSRTGGSGTDFFGVREYQIGDPRRWINWRVSARDPRNLYTNEYEQERIADVGLILDARERTDVTTERGSLFEYSVEATAALAAMFLKSGNRVALLVYGRGLERVFPGYGKLQRERIMRALAQARTGDSQVFDSLDYLPTRFFPAQSQIVLVSPLNPDDATVLSHVRARGYRVLVVSPDPISFEKQTRPDDRFTNLAVRIAHAERMQALRKLQRVGVTIVNWDVNRPLDKVLQAAQKRSGRGFL